jgi:hypothetical protein
MSQRSHARGEDDRRRFVADPDALAALGLTFEQLSDPDVRSLVIRHEHPEFDEALKAGRGAIDGNPAPGSGSARPRRRQGATTTPASRLVGQRERQGSATDGPASRPDDPGPLRAGSEWEKPASGREVPEPPRE